MANTTNAASLIDSINSINTTDAADTDANSSVIKLAALQAEYKVVMTMYQNAYQNYITSISNNIAATATATTPAPATATPSPDTPTAATTAAYMELPGKQYWGTTGLQEGAVNSKDDCQTMCSNSPNCTGATFDSSLNYCWARSGDGSIDPGSSTQNAIILNNEFPIIVLKMLNDKLFQLNDDITNELQYTYSYTDQDQITKSQLSDQLTELIQNKNRINNIITSTTNTIGQEFNESELYVTQSYTYYNLYFVIILVLTALYIGNNVFSIITLILLILIITVNTTIFSGIAILLLLLVFFYLKSN